jgi:hypothetical protein
LGGWRPYRVRTALTWLDFRDGETLLELGPFVFERTQYEAALS